MSECPECNKWYQRYRDEEYRAERYARALEVAKMERDAHKAYIDHITNLRIDALAFELRPTIIVDGKMKCSG